VHERNRKRASGGKAKTPERGGDEGSESEPRMSSHARAHPDE
jgi:hypothetical protein